MSWYFSKNTQNIGLTIKCPIKQNNVTSIYTVGLGIDFMEIYTSYGSSYALEMAEFVSILTFYKDCVMNFTMMSVSKTQPDIDTSKLYNIIAQGSDFRDLLWNVAKMKALIFILGIFTILLMENLTFGHCPSNVLQVIKL